MAWYDTGTVSVTNGSTAVTGSGTNFVAGAQVGEGFYGPDGRLYEIQAIVSATSLTLADAYLGTTQTGQEYKIVPTQSLVADLASQVSTLISDYQSVADNAGEGKFQDGSATSPGITFTLDQDTGFFRDTANEIGVAVAGVKKAEFNSSGMQFEDNSKAIFGAGSDLEIYHDGSNSWIRDVGTGSLILKADGPFISLQNSTGNDQVLVSGTDVKLSHSGSTKLSTTSTGVDVTGTVTADGLTVDGDAEVQGLRIDAVADVDLEFGYANTTHSKIIGDIVTASPIAGQLKFQTSTGGTLYERMRIATNGDISFYEATGTTPKMVWSASAETLSIGTYNGAGTPSGSLFVDSNANNHAIHIEETGGGSESWQIGVNTDGDLGFYNSQSTTASITFDDSGNLLVGRTDTSSATAGTVIYGGSLKGAITQTFAGRPLYINRLTSDGDIIEFAKDGTTVGSIGTSGGDFYVGNGTRSLMWTGTSVFPRGGTGGISDATVDLGNGSNRFDDIYAANALIQTSDANEKQDIAELDEAERRVAVAAKGLLRKFRWKDAVAEKGDDARIHFGIIAQDLQAAFEAEGLDAGRYAMFIHSTWTDEETGEERSRMGVRYSELLAFIIAAI